MVKAWVASRVRLMKAIENRDAGQGTLEYVGMLVAVAAVAALVVGVLKQQHLDGKVGEAFSSVFK